MNYKDLTSSQKTYLPQLFKNFDGALEAFLAEECPQIGGIKTRIMLVSLIRKIVDVFFPKRDYISSGQVLWNCVHKDEKSGHGKKMSNTRLTSVVLDLITTEEIESVSNGESWREIKKKTIARICNQAYEQSGVLAGAEMSLLLKITEGTVSSYIKEWETENKKILPRRGTIHDLGRSLTHKRIIIEKLVFEGKKVEEVCRETNHSPQAVLRYITNFKQVLLCRRKKFDTLEIAFAVGMSIGLVEEYNDLIDDYKKEHPNLEMEGEPWLDSLIENLEKVADIQR